MFSVTVIDECPRRSMIALGSASLRDEEGGAGVAQVVEAGRSRQPRRLHGGAEVPAVEHPVLEGPALGSGEEKVGRRGRSAR